jgi:hypothetical protein
VSKGEAPPFTHDQRQGQDQAPHQPGNGEVDDCVVVGERPVPVLTPTTPTLPLLPVAYAGRHTPGPHHPHGAPSTPNFGYHHHHHHHHTAAAAAAASASTADGYCYPHRDANLPLPPQKTTTSPSSPSSPPAAGSHGAAPAPWATAHSFGLAQPPQHPAAAPAPSEFCCERHRHLAQ